MIATADTPRQAVPVAEVARALSISRATAHRRIADGSIHAIRIGPTVRVPVAELRRLLDGGAR
jgi:excisionase family DNA binding protein